MIVCPFDDLDLPDLVYTINYNKPVTNRHILYCAIPCQIKDKYEELDVISVRWQGLHKGETGGFFPSGMIIDFWLDGKRRHTKVYHSGVVHMSGVPSQDMAVKIATELGNILSAANEYINSTIGSRRFKKATDWLVDNSVGDEFECVNTFKLKNDTELGSMEFCKCVTENSIRWPTTVPDEYKSVLGHYKVLCDDLISNNNAAHTALVSRVDIFLDAQRCDDEYIISTVNLCNSVYRYKLGYPLDRYKFADVLANLQYDVHYPSSSIAEVIVSMTVDDVVVTFRFYPKGSVNLNSCVIKASKKAYEIIMADIAAHCDVFKLTAL